MRNAHRHWIAGALAAAAIATGTTHAAADEPRRGPGLDEALDDEALEDVALDDDEPCAEDELMGGRREAAAASPEPRDRPRVKSWGMVGAGTATALIGLLPTFFGVALIAEDQAQDGDLLDGLGTTAGGILTAVGVAHLAIGIPLIAVGAQGTAGEEGAPAGPRVDVRAGLGSAELFVTF